MPATDAIRSNGEVRNPDDVRFRTAVEHDSDGPLLVILGFTREQALGVARRNANPDSGAGLHDFGRARLRNRGDNAFSRVWLVRIKKE